jgi:hypothetical protein
MVKLIASMLQLLKSAKTPPQCVVILGAGMEASNLFSFFPPSVVHKTLQVDSWKLLVLQGCETAAVLTALGSTTVHLINGNRCILPREDDDVSQFAQQALTSDGVKVKCR